MSITPPYTTHFRTSLPKKTKKKEERQKEMICDKGIEMKFVVLLLLGVFVWGDEGMRCIEREREALVRFKNGLTDEDDFLSSWRTDECCNWYGVVCSNTTDDGHVISLELGTGDFDGVLGGKVSSSLLELHHLNYLDLSYNDFGGDPIPEFIGSMKQLRHLYLRKSEFSGIVPPQLGYLTNLLTLDLSHNSLKSENLDWLSNLSSLSVLDLSDSLDLNGTNWLHQILNLHSLQELHLQSCNISDVNPSIVNSSSPSLSFLDLSNNHLTPSAFDWLSNVSSSLVKVNLSQNALGGLSPNALERLSDLSHVEHLDLSSNMLEGEIPKALGNLSHLRVLVLYHNKLRGDLNEFIGNLSSKGIEILDLSRNQFNGSLPDLTAFSALTELYLHNNKFTGFMPHSVGQLSKLEVLDVSDNSLNGTVFETHLIKLANLKILDLSFNSLILRIAPDWSPPFQLDHIFLAGCDVGPSFPKWIQTQRTYTTLDLSSSDIKGEIPEWLWSLSPSIRYLFLSNNQINGTIPADSSPWRHPSGYMYKFFYNSQLPNAVAHKVNSKYYSSLQWKGQELEYRWHLILLKLIDFSSNRLSGTIPHSLSSMKGLISLNLSRNSLTGNIIPDIGQMEMLECLDLSHNQLSGEIPMSLAQLHFLGVLDLSDNNLSGKIPSSTQLQSFNMSSYAGNNGLCGRPLELCPNDSPRPITQGEEGDGLIWSFSFMQGLCISIGFGFIVGFWGAVGSLVLKKSLRYAYFNLLDDVGDWLYVRISIFLSKWRCS